MKAKQILMEALPHCAMIGLKDWDILTVSGKDRMDYLKGVLTQSVHPVAVGGGNLHLYLSNKGRIQGEVLLHKRPDRLLLLSEPNTGAELLKFLQQYHILEDLTFSTEHPGVIPYACVGQGWHGLLQQHGLTVPEDKKATDCASLFSCTEPVWLAKYPRLQNIPFYILWVPSFFVAHVESMLSSFSIESLSSAAWEHIRLLGRWVHAQEMRELLVHEADLQHTHVDFKKGCFLGQEVVARTEHRGQANKGIYLLATAYPKILTASTEVLDETDKEVGQLLAHKMEQEGWNVYTALLKHKAMEEAQQLHVNDGDSSIILEWMQWPSSTLALVA